MTDEKTKEQEKKIKQDQEFKEANDRVIINTIIATSLERFHKMKTARVEAEFAELKGNNVVIANGSASSAALAVARAARYLFADPKVKGRRIKTFKATFYISKEIPTT